MPLGLGFGGPAYNTTNPSFDGITINNGFLNFGARSELTIASGVVTVTSSFHTIDTEADASSDNLDTISGGADGDLLVIMAESSGRTVVCKDGTGNLRLAGDFTMDDTQDKLFLIFYISTWHEISRSNNG